MEIHQGRTEAYLFGILPFSFFKNYWMPGLKCHKIQGFQMLCHCCWYLLSFIIDSLIPFSAHLLFLLLPLSFVSLLLCIFVEEVIYIPLAVEHHQRVIFFAISRLDAMGCVGSLLRTERHSLGIQLGRLKVCALFFKGCIFAKGRFRFGSIFRLLLLQLGKTGFCDINVLPASSAQSS